MSPVELDAARVWARVLESPVGQDAVQAWVSVSPEEQNVVQAWESE